MSSLASQTPKGRQLAADAAILAVIHIMNRMQKDPRLAYYLGPGSESFERLTKAYALHQGVDLDQITREFTETLTFEPPPAECGPEPREIIVEYRRHLRDTLEKDQQRIDARLYLQLDPDERHRLEARRDALNDVLEML